MHDEESGAPAWLERLDHPADEMIRVQAASLAELFERVAWAMFSCITDMAAVRPATARDVQVSAPDRDALLVRWLAELNRLHHTEGLLAAQFRVLQLDSTGLQARVHGEPMDPVRHTLHAEIKGVTFHGLRIESTGTDWRATVLFDM